jgi:succinate dehydrogenase flavin-adding protein (antitoxin of CptAB toxin-antitoxin module)
VSDAVVNKFKEAHDINSVTKEQLKQLASLVEQNQSQIKLNISNEARKDQSADKAYLKE